MAFRKVARGTERFDIQWAPPLEASSMSEADASAIGAFLHRIGHPLHRSCQQGALRGATCYVTRLFDYHRNDLRFALSLQCSTLVRDTGDNRIVGVCMVGGGGSDGMDFGVYDMVVEPVCRNRGVGSNMLKRAMTILAEHSVSGFHLWRNDDSPAVSLYERLGFVPTGEAE